MSGKRPRSVANPNVGVKEYVNLLKPFLSDDVLGGLVRNIPKLCQELRHIQPHHVVALHKLLRSLLMNGVGNGVLFTSKFEMAVKEIMSVCSTTEYRQSSVELFAARFTDHVRFALAMIRNILLEETSPWSLKYSKTNQFRKSCSTSEMVIVRELVSMLTLDAAEESSSVVRCAEGSHKMLAPAEDSKVLAAAEHSKQMLSPAEDSKKMLAPAEDSHKMAPAEDNDDDEISIDSDGFPTVFFKTKLKVDKHNDAANITPTATPRSVASTEYYPSEIDEGDVPIVTPRTKDRKKQVLQRRQELSSVKQPAAKAKATSKPGWDEALHLATVGGPTAESNPRCEINAKSKASNLRVHLFTLSRKSWGGSFARDAKRIVDAINKDGLSKSQALKLREELRNK